MATHALSGRAASERQDLPHQLSGGKSVLVSVYNPGCRQARMRILRFARARLSVVAAPSSTLSDVGFPALARVRPAQAMWVSAGSRPRCLATVPFELAGSNVCWSIGFGVSSRQSAL
jgi:hypothetical protein